MNIKEYILSILLVFACYIVNSQSFEHANGYNVTLDEIDVLDNKSNYGNNRNLIWNVIFLEDKNQIVYTRVSPNRKRFEIVIKDLSTLEIITSFEGSKLYAVSPDRNRIFFDDNIYDIELQKTFTLNSRIYFHDYWVRGKIAWIDDNKIIAYQNTTNNGTTKPKREYYYYLDLDDLQIKKMNDTEINRVFPIIQSLKNNHENFYLYIKGSSDILIQDKNTPYSKSILQSISGYPINQIWSSNNLEYLAVSKYSQRFTNNNEFVLYKLNNTIKDVELSFNAANPIKWFDDKFKLVFNQTSGSGIWADVYEPKINPLNEKVIGPDKKKYKGSMRITKIISSNEIELHIGYHKSNIKFGDVITNFRKTDYIKDRNGAWTILKGDTLKQQIETDNFEGKWKGYYLSFLGNKQVEEKEPTFTFTITKENGKYKIIIENSGMGSIDNHLGSLINSKIVIDGKAKDFYKYQIPTIEKSPNTGTLIFSDGGATILLKRFNN